MKAIYLSREIHELINQPIIGNLSFPEGAQSQGRWWSWRWKCFGGNWNLGTFQVKWFAQSSSLMHLNCLFSTKLHFCANSWKSIENGNWNGKVRPDAHVDNSRENQHGKVIIIGQIYQIKLQQTITITIRQNATDLALRCDILSSSSWPYSSILWPIFEATFTQSRQSLRTFEDHTKTSIKHSGLSINRACAFNNNLIVIVLCLNYIINNFLVWFLF